MRPIPLPLQNIYAELVEQCAATEMAREFPAYGGFAVKTVAGRRYIYWQGQINGQRIQKSVGVETPELLNRIARHREIREADLTQRTRLVSALVEAGQHAMPPSAAKIALALSHAGVFRRGGVLVGSWAYAAYSPILGFYMPMDLAQTQDLDIALVEIAIDQEPIDVASALKAADASFAPAFSSPHASEPPYAFINRDGYRVEFLTILRRGKKRDSARPKSVNTGAMPLRFLEYLFENTLNAVVLYRHGLLIRVPSPLRFALHKLIVSQIRTRESAAKRTKDILQSAAILEVLAASQPDSVSAEWKALLRRGPAWRKHATAGAQRLPQHLQALLRARSK